MSEATEQVVVGTPNEEPSEETPELSNVKDDPIEAMEAPVKKKRASRKKTILQTADPNVEVEVKSRNPGPKKKKIVVYKEDISLEPKRQGNVGGQRSNSKPSLNTRSHNTYRRHQSANPQCGS